MKHYEFKQTPKGYRYINGKRVSLKTWIQIEDQCFTFDSFYSHAGYRYKYGRAYK